jgi:hypothetical protein
MRTLNDYFLYGGQFTAVQTIDNIADVVAVCPDAGKVLSVIINVHTVIGAPDVTFDVLKNGTDTTVDVTLPGATPDESGVEMVLPSDVFVEIGDALTLRSNGEQGAATVAEITWVIRR